MKYSAFIYAIILAFSFGICPLVGRAAHLSGGWMTFFIAIGAVPLAAIGIGSAGGLPAGKALLLGLLAGLINGIGLYAYGRLIAGKEEVSKYLPMALALSPAIIALGGIIFFGESFTIAKIAGLCAVMVAIYLLCL